MFVPGQDFTAQELGKYAFGLPSPTSCVLVTILIVDDSSKQGNKGKQFLLYAGVYGMFYRVKHSALYLSVCVYFMMSRPNAGKCFHETQNAGTLNKDRTGKDLLTAVSDEPVFV